MRSRAAALECPDSPFCVGKQIACFTSIKQDWYYKAFVQIALCSKPDVMAMPDPFQLSNNHLCCCDLDEDVCCGDAILQ